LQLFSVRSGTGREESPMRELDLFLQRTKEWFFQELEKTEKKRKSDSFFRSGMFISLRVQFWGFMFLERAESV